MSGSPASGNSVTGELVTVEFLPSGRRVRVPRESTLLQAVRELGGDLDRWGVASVCGGAGTCGQCLVKVLAGRVSGPGERELELLARSGAPADGRLACQTRVMGAVTVELGGAKAGAPLQVTGKGREVTPQPLVGLHPFRVPAPSLHDPRADAERVAAALPLPGGVGSEKGAQGSGEGRSGPWVFDCAVLRGLSSTLRRQGFQGAAVVRRSALPRWTASSSRSALDGEVIALAPPEAGRLLGMAVDLGTTKIAVYLVDLESGEVLQTAAALNPQADFGADVISRLGYAMESGENRKRLRRVAVDALNDLAAEVTRKAGCGAESIYDMLVAGNTAMHHLVTGLGLSQLAVAPYVAAVTGPLDVKARELGLEVAPGAYVHLLPCIAGFVGGDHVGVLLATELDTCKGVTLAIDVGTNTEIALAKNGTITCCSCASGPAFEGWRVTRGMRAADGAIDRVWTEKGEIRYRVIGGGGSPPVWPARPSSTSWRRCSAWERSTPADASGTAIRA